MLLLGSVLVSSLLHFRDNFNQTENTQKSNKGNFNVDHLKDKGNQDNNWVENIDEFWYKSKTVSEEFKEDFYNEESQQEVVDLVVNLADNVSLSIFSNVKVVWQAHFWENNNTQEQSHSQNQLIDKWVSNEVLNCGSHEI